MQVKESVTIPNTFGRAKGASVSITDVNALPSAYLDHSRTAAGAHVRRSGGCVRHTSDCNQESLSMHTNSQGETGADDTALLTSESYKVFMSSSKKTNCCSVCEGTMSLETHCW